MEEQAADLRAALEIGAERQHLGAEGPAQLGRGLGQRADPVGIKGLLDADPAEHLAGAADLRRCPTFSSTNTNRSPSGVARRRAKARLGARELGDQRALVRRQVGEAAAGQLRHLVDRLEILVPRRAHPEAHKSSPLARRRMVSADNCARSTRLSTIRYSVRNGWRRRARPSCRRPARRRRRYCCRRRRRRVSRQPIGWPRSAPQRLTSSNSFCALRVDRLGRRGRSRHGCGCATSCFAATAATASSSSACARACVGGRARAAC